MLQHQNPPGLREPTGRYSQLVTATGTTTVYVAGQVATDAAGTLIGDDLGAQARQVFANLRTALAAAGAGPAEVAKLTIYVVGFGPGSRDALLPELEAMFGEHPPANTLLGVQALARPEYLLEIDAVAVLD